MTNSNFVFWSVIRATLLCPLCLSLACRDSATVRLYSFAGTTMGTTYSVKIVVDSDENVERSLVERRIQEQLESVNATMSSWEPSSDVCRFNRHTDTQTPLNISSDTTKVLKKALEVAQWTDGAFDPTIDPLVERWGFGTDTRRPVPDSKEIEALLEKVGYQKLDLGDNQLSKQHPELHLNLSAIAKGYGVDAVAEILKDMGYLDFMVEIGGEVRTSGLNLDRGRWRIGIESPDVAVDQRRVYCVAQISGYAIATSGNYRNFFVHNDTKLGHIIDPHTGRPVLSNVASVSVIAQDCLTADALATAFTVLGVKASMALTEQLPGVECLILRSTSQEGLIPELSSGMGAFVNL